MGPEPSDGGDAEPHPPGGPQPISAAEHAEAVAALGRALGVVASVAPSGPHAYPPEQVEGAEFEAPGPLSHALGNYLTMCAPRHRRPPAATR